MAPDPIYDLLPASSFYTDPVYHYTDADGFNGAIKDGLLRATEAFGLNDTGELRHGWDFIRDWLNDQAADEVIEDMRAAVPGHGEEDSFTTVYVLCASTREDDASQWRLYAGGGHGYVLELDPKVELVVQARTKLTESRNDHNTGIGVEWQHTASVSPWMRVMYSKDEKRGVLKHFKGKLENRLQVTKSGVSTAPHEEVATDLLENWKIDVSSGLATIAQIMKAEAFEGESEVRCVATLVHDTHCYFRPTHTYGMVRHVNLMTKPSASVDGRVIAGEPGCLPVVGVMLGPGLVPANATNATVGLLQRHGYPASGPKKIAIGNSSAQLR